MAFGWSGAAAGASQSLEDILVRKALEKQNADRLALQQQQQELQAATQQQAGARQDAQINQRAQEFEYGKTRDAAADARLVQQDAAGANQRGLELMKAEADLMPKPVAAPTRRVITTLGKRGEPISKAFTDEELAEGVPQYRAPVQGAAPSREQEWVIRDGKPVPIPKGTAQPGDQPYDAVAARSSQPVNNEEALDTAREVQRLAGQLAGSKGFGGVFGKFSSMTPQLAASQDTLDSRPIFNSLKGLLTMENMGKMKGVLSDSDMRILQQASTTLDASMSEEAAAAELNRLGRVMSKLTGEPWQDVGAVPANTGAGGGRAAGAGPAGGGGFRVVGQR